MARVVFALDDYLKAEKYLYIDSISENNEAFSMHLSCTQKYFYGQVDVHLAEGL